MDGFKFRLQKVLDLRVWREKEKAARLIEARQRVEEARRAVADLQAIRAATRQQLALAHGAGGSVGHLQNLSYVLAQIDARIAEADAVRLRAEEQARASLADFAEAFQQRKVLEQLRERQLEDCRASLVQADRKAMDELATTRHGGLAAAAPAPGSER
jgi:flagellar export protein FliJ